MIKPTIGRQVWFWGGIPQELQQAEAATIAYVHGDRLVNLQVIDHNGIARSETSVSLVQAEDSEKPTGFFCEWMPFQKGQAVRTEQLERAIDAGQIGIGAVER